MIIIKKLNHDEVFEKLNFSSTAFFISKNAYYLAAKRFCLHQEIYIVCVKKILNLTYLTSPKTLINSSKQS